MEGEKVRGAVEAEDGKVRGLSQRRRGRRRGFGNYGGFKVHGAVKEKREVWEFFC